MSLKRSNSSRNLAEKASPPKSPKKVSPTRKPPRYPKNGKTGKMIHGIAHKSGGKNKTQRRR